MRRRFGVADRESLARTRENRKPTVLCSPIPKSPAAGLEHGATRQASLTRYEPNGEIHVRFRAKRGPGVAAHADLVQPIWPDLLTRDRCAASLQGHSALIDRGHAQKPCLPLVLAAEEVGELRDAARRLEAHLLPIARSDRTRLGVHQRIERREAVGDARARAEQRQRALLNGARERVVPPRVVVVQEVRVLLNEPVLPVRRPQWASRTAALRLYDNDTVCGVSAVERRRRRPLYHLHRLDLFRIEIVEAAGGQAIASDRGGAVFHPRSVDDEQRIICNGDAVQATDARSWRAAGQPVVQHDLRARHASIDQIREARHRRIAHHAVRLDSPDRIADLQPPLRPRHRHHHLFELRRNPRQNEIGSACTSIRDRDRP